MKMRKNDAGDYTVKQLIEKLGEYPDDTTIWFMFQHSNGLMTLFDLAHLGMFTLGDTDFVHFVLENSNIYNETKKCQHYNDEISKLNIETRELKNQIKNLTGFIMYKGYNLDDFNDYLIKKWKKE